MDPVSETPLFSAFIVYHLTAPPTYKSDLSKRKFFVSLPATCWKRRGPSTSGENCSSASKASLLRVEYLIEKLSAFDETFILTLSGCLILIASFTKKGLKDLRIYPPFFEILTDSLSSVKTPIGDKVLNCRLALLDPKLLFFFVRAFTWANI